MVYDPALGYDPAMTNQALAMQGSTFQLPTLANAQANAAQFPALPQQGEGVSMLEQAAAAQALPAADVSPAFSMVPTEQPPVMRAEEPASPRAPEPGAGLMRQPQQAAAELAWSPPARPGGGGGGGGGGVANPLPGMLADAGRRRVQAETAATDQEAAGDVASAKLEQSAADVGEARQSTYGDMAARQRQLAQEAAAFDGRLADEQANYDKAYNRTQAEQRELTKFIGNYEPKDRRSTRQLAMGALAVALSGLADNWRGTTSGVDAVMANINRGIDRDLQMQQSMLDNKRTALAASNTEMGQLRARFGDDVDTLKLARVMKLEQAQQELEAIKTQGVSKEAGPMADQAIAQIQLDRANLLRQVNDQRFQQHYSDEQRLTMARAAQIQAAQAARQPRVMSPKEALELEGKALENEKARRELESGPGGKPLTAEQQKRRSLFEGKDEAARHIANLVAEGEAAPGMLGRNVPDWMRSASGDQVDTAIAAMEEVLLRDQSGASISDGDKAAKRAAWGLTRGEEARKRGLRMMLDEYNSSRESVGLNPIEPVVRRGAAR